MKRRRLVLRSVTATTPPAPSIAPGLKTVMAGKPLSAAVDKYRSEIWDSCRALWSVWVPAQLVNFACEEGEGGGTEHTSCGQGWPRRRALTGASPPSIALRDAVVPRHMRIPYVAAVSFGWTVILSVMQSKFDTVITQNKAAADAPHAAAATPGLPAPLPVPLPAAALSPALKLGTAPAVPPAIAAVGARLPSAPFLAAAVAEAPAGRPVGHAAVEHS